MLNKIFLILLAVAIVGVLGLTYFQYSWLQSLTKPSDVVANYDLYNNIYWSFFWISSLVLLVVANIVLWQSRKSWALWTSLSYFVVFISIQMWWLGGLYFDYKKQNNLETGAFPFGGIIGVLFCALAAVVVFFDHFLVLKMRDRIHGNPALTLENNIEPITTTAKEKVLSETEN